MIIEMIHIPYIDDNALMAHSIINFFKSFKTVKSFEWSVKNGNFNPKKLIPEMF